MKKAVIFDWSGTLHNKLDSFLEVCDCIFKELGKKPITHDEVRKSFTIPYMLFWNKYFPHLTKEDQHQLFMKYIQQVKQSEAYPEAKAALEYIRERKYAQFVVSSDPTSTLIPEIKQAGLERFFKKVYGDVYEKAPSLKSIVAEFGLDKNQTYYVGDTSGDIYAGKAAGMKTIGISWGFQHKDLLAASKPDYLIDNLKDIKKII